MKMMILSEVNMDGMVIKDEYIEDFGDENVFGKVLKYHERMKKVFPGCEFKLVKTKRVEG